MSKVLLVNGSPKAEGCTYTALKEIADTLAKEGVESEIFHVRSDTPGCRDCGYCSRKGRCSIKDDVNAIADRLDEFDAIVLGSPVYYAGPSGRSVRSPTGCSTATPTAWPGSWARQSSRAGGEVPRPPSTA